MSPEKLAALREIESNLIEHDFPPQLIAETTAFCNFQCSHCHHRDLRRNKGVMSHDLWTKIVAEVAEHQPDAEFWPTFYGEALLLGDKLFDWLHQARDMGLTNLVLNSNGSFCRGDNNDKILRSGLRRFLLSLDGFTKPTFERVRATRDPHGKFEPVYTGVAALLERKQTLDRQGVDTTLIICQFSMMDENEHEADDFKDYWLSRGAHVKLREKLTWTGFVQASNLTASYRDRVACPWTNNTCAIHWNGDVVACAVDNEGEFVAGNVNDESIHEIWNGPLKKLRQTHREHIWDDLPELCQRCVDWQAVGASHYSPDGRVYHSVVATE